LQTARILCVQIKQINGLRGAELVFAVIFLYR